MEAISRSPASQGLFHRLGAVAGSPQTAGLIDQSIVSASNFTLTWMLARKLGVADYGLYVMLIGLILALNSVQSALIVFPFTVRYAGSDPQLWQSGVVHCLLVSLITLCAGINRHVVGDERALQERSSEPS